MPDITPNQYAGPSLPIGSEDVRRCAQCGTPNFHIVVERMVFTPGGARRMALWSCEVHPLPENGLTSA